LPTSPDNIARYIIKQASQLSSYIRNGLIFLVELPYSIIVFPQFGNEFCVPFHFQSHYNFVSVAISEDASNIAISRLNGDFATYTYCDLNVHWSIEKISTVKSQKMRTLLLNRRNLVVADHK